ncbi:MAG: LamG domain-containing protein [Chloroflexota bacterium]|nr:MAG: LamG domain-containing protein [Chloroflexota bacterium]
MKTKIVHLTMLFVLLALAAMIVPLAPAQAMSDVPCDATALINAIQGAVNAGGTQSLSLAASCTYTLTAVNNGADTRDANGLPVIANNVSLTIVGNGATIQRDANAPQFRILSIDAGSTLLLSSLTIRGGRGVDGSQTHLPGPGGGIFNRGTLDISFSNILENHAGDGLRSKQPGAVGGGIANDGTLILAYSNVTSNVSGDGDDGKIGATGGDGGGIYNVGNATITNSAIYGNKSGAGGDGTTKNGGRAGYGAGIMHFEGQLILANSTVSGNKGGKGGKSNSGQAGLGGSGGGLAAQKGNVTITNSTIAKNKSGAPNGAGAGIYAFGTVKLQNTIVADNAPSANCYGNIKNVTNNLDTGTSCGFGSNNDSKSNADPNLEPLASNGAGTLSHAFKKPSDAYNKGKDSVCNSDPINGQDQRGMSRSQGKHCDIGAFELQVSQPTPTATHTPTLAPTNTPTPSPTPTQPTGGDGGALDFDGTEDFVEIGTYANLLLNDDLTLEIWAKPDSFNDESTLITRAVEGDGDASTNYSYYFYITAAKKLGLFWEWGTGAPDTEITLTSSVAASINPGEWHHFAVTRNATGSQVRFYVDGVELGPAQSFTTLPTGGSSGRTVIGANPFATYTTHHFDGHLDEARIWNIVRTPAEIQANLYQQPNVASSGLVAYYKFDEPSGQTVSDATTPAENGTLGKTSSVATDDPTRVTSTTPGGDCAGPSDGRVSCWKGENNANDSVGTNNGTLEGSVTFVEGKVGQAFNFDGTTADVRVPASSSLNVGSANGLTIAAWVNPTTLAQRSPLVEWSNNGTYGADFWMSVTDVIPGGVNGNLYANLTSFAHGTQYVVQTTGAVLTANSWNHVVFTYNKTNGNVAIYVNGVASSVSSSNLGIVTPDTSFDMYLARRVAGQAPAARLSGKMDEVQIWNRALTAQEISSMVGTGDCAGPSDGRVSCWKGDNNANDSVDTNNGTVQGGATYAAGKVGQAFSFDGVDDYVQVADHASLRPTQFTVAGWFNATAFAGQPGGNAIIAHGASGSGTLGEYHDTYFLGFYESKPQFQTFTTVTGNHNLPGPNVIPTGQWHHLAATFESGAKKLYLDGTLIASETVSGSLVYETPIPITIGQDWNIGAPSNNVMFNGLLDEVQVWNRALTAQEILDLYNAQ